MDTLRYLVALATHDIGFLQSCLQDRGMWYPASPVAQECHQLFRLLDAAIDSHRERAYHQTG